jgi:AraC family transcriptional regulator
MKLYIKNMVCDRCIMVVRQQLEGLGYEIKDMKLGETDITPEPDQEALKKIRHQFESVGFELIEDKKEKVVEKIKALIAEQLNNKNWDLETNLSSYLIEKTGFSYHYLSHVFSELENTTIEKFVIAQKTEKVKEYLRYGELNISEIAWKFGYSSIQALSNQFKKVTGMTPSQFRKKEELGK